MKEDDPNNPSAITDNDGDIAGKGEDLFGSVAESTCATLILSSTSNQLVFNKDAVYFPLIITSTCILNLFPQFYVQIS